MKGTVIALDTWARRGAAAIMVDGQLDDIIVAPPKREPAIGAIFAAVAERPLKGTGGQFVKLPDGLKGFLKGNAPQGRVLAVQVNGCAEPGKAIPVTSRIVLKSRTTILTPGAKSRSIARSIKGEAAARLKSFADTLSLPSDTGIILRTAAVDAATNEVELDVERLMAKLARISSLPDAPTLLVPGRTPEQWAASEWDTNALWDTKPESFERHGIAEALEAVLEMETPLPSGGSVIVEATRALVAVDVNSGGAHGGNQGLTATLEALSILPRLLRLRGLGGQVTVDCAPFAKAHRRTVEQRIAKVFGADSVETNFAGWTPLGHIELTRKRERFATPRNG